MTTFETLPKVDEVSQIKRLIDSMTDESLWTLGITRSEYSDYAHLTRRIRNGGDITYSPRFSMFALSASSGPNIELSFFQGLRAYWRFKARLKKYNRAIADHRRQEMINFLNEIGD